MQETGDAEISLIRSMVYESHALFLDRLMPKALVVCCYRTNLNTEELPKVTEFFYDKWHLNTWKLD